MKYRSQRRTVKPGQVMQFMELPDGSLYWHLNEKGFFKKIGNSHSHSPTATVIHGLHDAVKVVPETFNFKTTEKETKWIRN